MNKLTQRRGVLKSAFWMYLHMLIKGKVNQGNFRLA
jgi:hypothetical protein